MDELKKKVLDVMNAAGEPLKAGQLVEMTGLAKTDIDKVMKLLKKEALIESPKRCFWQPK